MAIFRDALGQDWHVEFDAFLLDDVQKLTGVNLADIAAGGYYTIGTDDRTLGLVVCALCVDELKAKRMEPRELAKRIRKDAIPRARKAVEEAAADFFPQSEWSEIQSNLERQKADPMKGLDREALSEMLPLMQAFTSLPESIQRQLIESEKAGLSSEPSPAGASATGQDAIPLNAATASQENAEPQQGG